MQSLRSWMTLCLISLLLIAVCPPALPANEYILHPGDTLTVVVTDHQEFGGTVTISAAGTIRLPVVNEITAGGKTIPELTAELIRAYKKRLLEPELFVTLATPHISHAYVIGAVKNPGIYPLQAGSGVFEVLMLAGGLAGVADECDASLVRKATGEVLAINLPQVMAGTRQANITLEDGDLLRVELPPTIQVYVTGQVEVPGLYELPEKATFSQAIAGAKGIRGNPGDCQAVIQRGTSIIQVDLAAIFTKYDPKADIPLQKLDSIRVDASKSVAISGEVGKPATYQLGNVVDLRGLLNLAGGVTPFADLEHVILTHVDGTQETIQYDELTRTGATKALHNGDQVVIPGKFLTVTLTGQVNRPGASRQPPGATVADALLMAGGPTVSASLSAVKLLHPDGSEEMLDLNEANKASSVALHDGDQLIIPDSNSRVAVMGNVRNPGYFPMSEFAPYTAVQAVLTAGGFADRARPEKSYIIRPLPNGQTMKIAVDLNAAIKDGNPKENIVLAPGDMVYVPKASSLTWSNMLGVLSGLALIRNVFGL